MNNKKRLLKSTNSLNKTERKLMKARSERIWIESNTNIHILNYPFYKLIRILRL